MQTQMSKNLSNLLVGAFVFILLSCSISNGRQGTDDILIKKTLAEYYASLVNKDSEAVKALWSQDSPELVSDLKERIETFQAASKVALKSLTIDGIGAVIDTGFKRVPRFDPASGMTALETVRVSLAAADQRRGRAGRRRDHDVVVALRLEVAAADLVVGRPANGDRHRVHGQRAHRLAHRHACGLAYG